MYMIPLRAPSPGRKPATHVVVNAKHCDGHDELPTAALGLTDAVELVLQSAYRGRAKPWRQALVFACHDISPGDDNAP